MSAEMPKELRESTTAAITALMDVTAKAAHCVGVAEGQRAGVMARYEQLLAAVRKYERTEDVLLELEYGEPTPPLKEQT